MASSAAFFFLFVALASSFFLCSAYRSEDLESDQKIRILFDHWCLKHGKIYQWDIERESRFLNFKSNLLWIDAQNKQNDRSFWLGLNQFADLSDQEIESLFTNRRDAEETIKMVTETNLPSTNSGSKGSSIDWRQKGAVTSVKNIKSCIGASWAFAATGSLEGLHKIKTGKLNGFSEQELLDCDTRGLNKGCDSGDAFQALKYIVHHGIASNSNYPFHSQQGTCKSIDQEEKVYIEDYRRFSGPDSILAELLITGPTIVHLDASAKEFVFYAGGIYTGPCHDTETNLYALAVGYKSEEGSNYFIMKNSWGDRWGEEGYMRIKQEDELAYGRCGISSNMAIPIDLKTSAEELIDSQPEPYQPELEHEHEWPIPAIPPGIIYPPPSPPPPPSIFDSPPPPSPPPPHHHYSSPPPPPPPPSPPPPSPPPPHHHYSSPPPPPPSKHHAPPPPSIFPAPPPYFPSPSPSPSVPAPTESTPPPPSPSSSPPVFSPFRSSIRALQGLFAVYMLEFVLV